jgi:hypothetical protein
MSLAVGVGFGSRKAFLGILHRYETIIFGAAIMLSEWRDDFLVFPSSSRAATMR